MSAIASIFLTVCIVFLAMLMLVYMFDGHLVFIPVGSFLFIIMFAFPAPFSDYENAYITDMCEIDRMGPGVVAVCENGETVTSDDPGIAVAAQKKTMKVEVKVVKWHNSFSVEFTSPELEAKKVEDELNTDNQSLKMEP